MLKTKKHLGPMEVMQDLTELKKLEGERRLLDWKDEPSANHFSEFRHSLNSDNLEWQK